MVGRLAYMVPTVWTPSMLILSPWPHVRAGDGSADWSGSRALSNSDRVASKPEAPAKVKNKHFLPGRCWG